MDPATVDINPLADPGFDLRGGVDHISIKIMLKINRERSERGKH